MSTFSANPEQFSVPDTISTTELRKTTLGELGGLLPIGVASEGALHRQFAFRRYTTANEREFETIRKEKKNISTPEFVIEILSRMCTRVGPYDFDSLDPSQRRLVLQNLYMGDVFYLWTCLRIEALGPDVRFKLDCAACRTELRPGVDLNSIDVRYVDQPSQLFWKHTLRDGLELGSSVEKELILQPPRWSILISNERNKKTAISDLKVSVAIGSIRQVGDGKKSPTRRDFDSMSKYDLEFLQKSVDDHAPGIEMEFEVECDQCDHKNRYGFDWTFDFFFGASSL